MEAVLFLKDLDRRIKDATGDCNSYQYLLQGISVLIQRGNAVSMLGTSKVQSDAFDFP